MWCVTPCKLSAAIASASPASQERLGIFIQLSAHRALNTYHCTYWLHKCLYNYKQNTFFLLNWQHFQFHSSALMAHCQLAPPAVCPCTDSHLFSSFLLETSDSSDCRLWVSSPPLQLSNPCALTMTPHMSQRLALHWPNQGCSPPSRQYLYRYWFVDLSWERAYHYIYYEKNFEMCICFWQFDCPEVTLYWLIDDHLYSAILRSLEQTHCARMWFYMSD